MTHEEEQQFLDLLYEIAYSHAAELMSPLMAPEDRVEEQESLDTVFLAIAAFQDSGPTDSSSDE